MELFFEGRIDIPDTTGRVNFFQCRPTIHPVPVLEGSSFEDGAGVSIYGTVLHDGGVYRMWYQAWPRDWGGKNIDLVGYAESDNGLDWRKPKLGLVDYRGHGKDNNLVAMYGHPPTLFIDPDSPPSHRYRATMATGPDHQGASADVTIYGYYTAHSADGFRWTYDQNSPRWPQSDVITCAYHPGRRCGIVSMKHNPLVNGSRRRSIWQAELINGEWSDAHAALIPDEFDDICAISRGYVKGDYYGMGLLPAGKGAVAFIWQFRHRHPMINGWNFGVYGIVDVTLAYQAGPRDRWMHVPGRPDFISHQDPPWAKGGIYTASCPVQNGNEHWLYFSAATEAHGWYLAKDWQSDPSRQKDLIERGMARIGVARWPLWRMFGFRSDPEGVLELNLGRTQPGSRLYLNYRCDTGGSVRVEVVGRPTHALDQAVALEGDSLARAVAWKSGDRLPDVPTGNGKVRLHMNRAEVYAYEVRDEQA